MESVESIAQKLVSKVEQRTGGLLTLTDEWDELKHDIAAEDLHVIVMQGRAH